MQRVTGAQKGDDPRILGEMAASQSCSTMSTSVVHMQVVSETQTTFGFFGNCQFAAMYIPMYLIPRYLYGFLSDFLLVHWPVDLGYIYLTTQSLSVTEQMGPYQR